MHNPKLPNIQTVLLPTVLCASVRHIIISYLLPDKIQEQSVCGYLLALIPVIDQIWHAP